MMTKTRDTVLRLTLLAALAAGASALCAPSAEAQCALCRTALQGASEATARTMNLGILVLLVPPVAIFCAIFVALKRKDGEDVKE
jgi:hypothetical protein